LSGPARSVSWSWSLVLVGCVHLLVTPGSWIVSDHAEELFMARRLITHGTLTLAGAGEPLPELPWWTPDPAAASRSRLFPGTALALLPLLAIDRALGWDRPREFGRLTHLGGHLYVWGALALLGLAVTGAGASPRAAAVMTVLVGTAWPTLQIGRHSGAEPVMAFLLAVFLWGRVSGRRRARAAACLLLPWINPTGCLLSLGLAAAALADAFAGRREAAERRRAKADAGRLAAIATAAVASVLLVWNQLYHGHWWGGGYATQGATNALLARSPVEAVAFFVSESLLFVPVLIMLAVVGGVAAGREGLRWLALAGWLLALHLALFAVFTGLGQDPARRLSVVWFAWGFVVGITWDRLGLKGRLPHGLMAIGLLLGLYWFELREWNYYPAGDGGYYPLVIWVTLALREGPTPRLILPVLALSGLGLLALQRSWRLLDET
jgi:hypothetical protein